MTVDAMEWLKTARKLDGELLKFMQIKVVEHGRLGQAIAFPYIRDGKPYADKLRGPNKTWASTQGVSRGLYNADVLDMMPGLPIVVTEGEIDCLSIMQSGFERCVSLPDGWTAEGNKTDALVAVADKFANAPYVIVAGDNDEAGESLPRVLANLLDGQDVRYVEWPDGCKDANDVLVTLGEGDLAACLNKAKRIDPPGGFITGFSDLPPLSRRRVLSARNPLIKNRLAFELGAMSVGTGTPGAGKSTLTTWVWHHVTADENVRAGLLSFETHPHRTRDHLSRLATGRAFDDLGRDDRIALEEDLDRRFRIVHRTFDDSLHTIGWLGKMVHTLATRDGCKIICIDPWNELEHLPEPGESLTNYINFALQQIRKWAEKLEIHICVIAHPKKMDMGRDPRAPMGYDIADSAAFFNKPSLGFTVHGQTTQAGTPYVELSTWKVRDSQLYGIFKGVSSANFDVERMDYEEIEL